MQELHVNWAHQKVLREISSIQFQIFVGHLTCEVNDELLFNAFFPYGCTDACVIWDYSRGQTKGYGFATFG